ncbi:energy-coupling factor transporter transmembrane protein EcfT [Deferribacter autotrophicus]|uniref:Energy-coupling factor transporter transmembrane protein EcfT n=1 Tax=Deferribacter autotrophicus TaxID=500465 RepID=A0A5A8F973_9BACT|nr:energy-coupling factor transporter transmembrane protein EcfT [Deferribacter autotrophicus]KAA0259542.1 energy-coupling factor transporter transmembrane protein EcfT [Deferribacter autotrophicus]
MNNLYFGRYLPKNSIIHNFHPLLKFLIGMSLILLIGVSSNIYFLLFNIILLLIISKTAKIQVSSLLKSVRPFIFLLMFTFFIQLFFTSAGDFQFNLNNLQFSIVYTLRFFIIILVSSLLTVTTPPYDFVKIIYFLLRPLKFLKVNVNDIAISSIIALRFIPLLFEESEKIRIAQKIRGEEKSFLKNLMSLDDFLIPLFHRIFYYSEQLSITLMYKRDWEKVLKISKPVKTDILFFLFFECLIFIGVLYV